MSLHRSTRSRGSLLRLLLGAFVAFFFIGGAAGGGFWLVTSLLGGQINLMQSASDGDSVSDEETLSEETAPAETEPRQVAGEDSDQDELSAAAPEAATKELAPQITKLSVKVQSGDTLMDLLTDAGADRGEAHAAITALSEVFSPRKLRVGQELELSFVEPAAPSLASVADSLTPQPVSENWRLMGLKLSPSVERDVRVFRQVLARAETSSTPDNSNKGAATADSSASSSAAADSPAQSSLTLAGFGDSFLAESIDKPLTRKEQAAAGVISSSLYNAAIANGVPNATLVNAIHLLSFDVDFQRDVQKNDSFELLYEIMTDGAGNRVKTGDLLYAEMILSGKAITLYRFKTDKGNIDYFDATGQSAKKGLLRTPVDGARLSSGYGLRKHPILGYKKKHKGLDFAAPRGTPIYAAGDGTVDYAGRKGSYGIYARIRHNGTYHTAYAHMKGLAKGIRKGTRVNQGQIIGYVGTTGRSTGPHLHYEVLRNGTQINPAKVKMPSGEKLAGKDLERFQQHRADIDERRRLLLPANQIAQANTSDSDATTKPEKVE
ncbi:peptidoglycan DD-metalloendopeptidase family protein [Rhodovibrionaceae bacterium A322]